MERDAWGRARLRAALALPFSGFGLGFWLWALDFGHWTELHFENVGAVAAAIAIGAADEDVAEELHLDLLEAGAAAPFTLALGGIEAEGTGIEAALPGQLRLGEKVADVVKRANINGRVRARGLAENGLVHQHDAAEVLGAVRGVREWRERSGSVVSFGVAIVFG